ncbi:hypothetical protein DE146DRAFT_719169 [Phaeosphaeria sp. MPI-PUGE-AT-0046c]|nr:hypothetical protein DE146DRAFT_719169 [Phaeosphaeria sp. MPI-PUGE-AT-0046c]
MYRVFRSKWIAPPQPTDVDYSGRNIIVTGATSGIGQEAAFKFAALGASKVIMTARDPKKGESRKKALEARLQKGTQLEVWELDMMSFDSVVAFAERAKKLEHIDIVVLNAGTWRTTFTKSSHGWEEDLQVNTLSTSLLMLLLLPKLRESKHVTGRTPVLEIVNSGLHEKAMVPIELWTEPNILACYNQKEQFGDVRQYKFSKVFLMYATACLAGRISSEDVIITSVCPGWVFTDLGRDYYFPGVYYVAYLFILLFMRTPAQGADMVLSGTTQGEKAHGRFWRHDAIQPIPPSLKGDEMKNFASRIFDEILAVLEASGQNVRELAASTSGCMPKYPFHRKPSAHGPSSLLRYLFPRTRARARDQLFKLRHQTYPSLKHHAQARIYKYIVYRQAQKLKRKTTVLQRLRSHTRKLIGKSYLENEARVRRREIATGPRANNPDNKVMSYQESYEQRESGTRRRKLAGYLKAANELRQTYTQQYAPSWRAEENYKFEDDTPGDFPDGAVVRSGEEEMIFFPSYARKHTKKKPEAEPGTIQEVEGEGRDSRDSTGAGDAEFWKKQWEDYEDDKAVVDVDVRGWIYSPFKGQMSRKQKLFIGLARQLVGIQAPPASTSEQTSGASSRDTSPGRTVLGASRERLAQRDEQEAAREAEQILRRGEKEAAVAAKGGYSEKPSQASEDDTQLYRTQSRDSVRTLGSMKTTDSRASFPDDEKITPLQKRASWAHPDNMDASELAEANTRLMARLRHFLAVPMANTPISVFFYNDQISKQRTIYTNAAGHFSMSAALDFIPTHVRILASEQLSATEEVIVTDSQGVSVISDIDDTIKHSAISSGAREIFRNAFIRELGDLTIDGVKEWYNAMYEQGVKFHYVSNSPWQLYPVISKYFALAGLPPGSFHLKQYSGMLQGIFEPVAERKKVTLDKIARDFPERRFILIGDSGEADLEVYTDFVLENPGRVIAVFIRDVTTSDQGGFFDPSIGPMPGERSTSSSSSPNRSGGSREAATQSSGTRGRHSEEHDPELKAALAASLKEADNDKLRRSKSMFPEIDQNHPDLRPRLPDRKPSDTRSTRTAEVNDLIDLSSDDVPENAPALRRVTSRSSTTSTLSKPPVAPKPRSIASSDEQSYSDMAKDKLWSVYNSLPALRSQDGSEPEPGSGRQGPPPPPPRRRDGAAGAISYVGSKANSAWQHAPSVPYHSRPQITSAQTSQPYSTSSPRQSLSRTGTGSTLGMNGGGGGGAGDGQGPYLNKREQLWRQRWAKAEGIMKEHGVILRSWRVGTDAKGDAEKIIKEADRRGR